MQSQTNKIILCIIINFFLLLILYFIPIKNENNFDLCVYKVVTGRECWNCGMTRAFLSVLRLDFEGALDYNRNVIAIFPLTVTLYIYSWYKYILREEKSKSE